MKYMDGDEARGIAAPELGLLPLSSKATFLCAVYVRTQLSDDGYIVEVDDASCIFEQMQADMFLDGGGAIRLGTS